MSIDLYIISFPINSMAHIIEVSILQKRQVNHDCYIFTLGLPHPIAFQMGEHFRIIQHLKTHEHPEGEEVVRKYTPISPTKQPLE